MTASHHTKQELLVDQCSKNPVDTVCPPPSQNRLHSSYQDCMYMAPHTMNLCIQ